MPRMNRRHSLDRALGRVSYSPPPYQNDWSAPSFPSPPTYEEALALDEKERRGLKRKVETNPNEDETNIDEAHSESIDTPGQESLNISEVSQTTMYSTCETSPEEIPIQIILDDGGNVLEVSHENAESTSLFQSYPQVAFDGSCPNDGTSASPTVTTLPVVTVTNLPSDTVIPLSSAVVASLPSATVNTMQTAMVTTHVTSMPSANVTTLPQIMVTSQSSTSRRSEFDASSPPAQSATPRRFSRVPPAHSETDSHYQTYLTVSTELKNILKRNASLDNDLKELQKEKLKIEIQHLSTMQKLKAEKVSLEIKVLKQQLGLE